MVDSIHLELSTKALSTRRTRSAIACNGCRKQKMKCANINKERCDRCKDKNIICEYSLCANTRPGGGSSSQSTLESQPSVNPSIASGVPMSQLLTPQAIISTPRGQSVSSAAPNRRADIAYAPSNVTGCPCKDPQAHGCVVSQIPVGELSDEMDDLNREIAQKYPAMPPLHD